MPLSTGSASYDNGMDLDRTGPMKARREYPPGFE